MAHIIVLGNEKGGSGKSTLSIHLSTALARLNHRVGVLDLDIRQSTTRRYLQNRQTYMQEHNLSLPSPRYFPLSKAPSLNNAPVNTHETSHQQIASTITSMKDQVDFILIDCPGSHTRLSQIAHTMADTLVTPLNDSFIDFDLLAKVSTDGRDIIAPSVYAQMVWQARQMRADTGLGPIDWVVVRNRVGSQAMINKAKMATAVDTLSKRIGFRPAPGFAERVIFRELFPAGMTLLDVKDMHAYRLNISHIAARQELRDLMKALRLPGVDVTF